jgi:hypothetical protein
LGGLRIVKTGSDSIKSEAKAKLEEGCGDYEDGLAIAPSGHRVKDAIGEWLRYGLTAGRARRRQAPWRSSTGHAQPKSWRCRLANRGETPDTRPR